MRKLKRGKLEEIIIEQNTRLKKLNDNINALRSQNQSLKTLLQRPGFNASWFDNNLSRVERELSSLRNLVDQRKEDHQELIDKIKKIEDNTKEIKKLRKINNG